MHFVVWVERGVSWEWYCCWGTYGAGVVDSSAVFEHLGEVVIDDYIEEEERFVHTCNKCGVGGVEVEREQLDIGGLDVCCWRGGGKGIDWLMAFGCGWGGEGQWGGLPPRLIAENLPWGPVVKTRPSMVDVMESMPSWVLSGVVTPVAWRMFE